MVTIGLRGHSWMAEVTPNYTSTCESGTMLDDEVITVHYYTPCTPVVLYPICQPLFRPWRSLEVTGEWGHPSGGCHLRFFSDHMFFGFAVGVKTSDPGQLHTCTPTFRGLLFHATPRLAAPQGREKPHRCSQNPSTSGQQNGQTNNQNKVTEAITRPFRIIDGRNKN